MATDKKEKEKRAVLMCNVWISCIYSFFGYFFLFLRLIVARLDEPKGT